ncbi:MAG TPA: DUF1150 family protein [Caulobacteraceae bacterium]|jgi:hypothetical protein
MTPTTQMSMLSSKAFQDLGAPDLVYVREIRASEVLAEAEVEDDTLDLDPDQVLYAVHSADGARLAVLIDKDSAFAAAVAHELVPVSVH